MKNCWHCQITIKNDLAMDVCEDSSGHVMHVACAETDMDRPAENISQDNLLPEQATLRKPWRGIGRIRALSVRAPHLTFADTKVRTALAAQIGGYVGVR